MKGEGANLYVDDPINHFRMQIMRILGVVFEIPSRVIYYIEWFVDWKCVRCHGWEAGCFNRFSFALILSHALPGTEGGFKECSEREWRCRDTLPVDKASISINDANRFTCIINFGTELTRLPGTDRDSNPWSNKDLERQYSQFEQRQRAAFACHAKS